MIKHENDLLFRTIDLALEEDLDGVGDITSKALFSGDDTATAIIRSKAEGVLSGSKLIAPIFSRCDSRVTTTLQLCDGDILQRGATICTLAGPVCAILAGERICLNFIQRLSGIATQTSKYVKAIAHTKTRLLDTRKTTPGLRYLEKAAVRDGMGYNHRFGLFDMMLIKDTHVKRAGGVKQALVKAFSFREQQNDVRVKIEIEVQSIEEFSDALALKPDRIMLDNMSLDEMRTCVTMRNNGGSRCELEASGNMQITTVASVAETGVDFISVGALTHSAPALDIHLIIQ